MPISNQNEEVKIQNYQETWKRYMLQYLIKAFLSRPTRIILLLLHSAF